MVKITLNNKNILKIIFFNKKYFAVASLQHHVIIKAKNEYYGTFWS